jgi:hypothetical protein
MNIDDRVNELEKKSKAKFLNILNVLGGILLFAALFVAAFKSYRFLTIILTLGLLFAFRNFLKLYRVRIEERLLRELRQTGQP